MFNGGVRSVLTTISFHLYPTLGYNILFSIEENKFHKNQRTKKSIEKHKGNNYW
jgi:hypothetical protein